MRGYLAVATTDAFTHGWDLARATGQPTDLDPHLAAELLARARAFIQPAFRGDDGAKPFGPQQPAPPNATNADALAAFLGRTVYAADSLVQGAMRSRTSGDIGTAPLVAYASARSGMWSFS